uniref:Uncharacterized protein n=1 Tax=Romanomermis culicivorax TaxID=13658 RepID=A0A915JQ80_ROMCU
IVFILVSSSVKDLFTLEGRIDGNDSDHNVFLVFGSAEVWGKSKLFSSVLSNNGGFVFKVRCEAANP